MAPLMAMLLPLACRAATETAGAAAVPPEANSPILLVACDSTNARQRWDILSQQMGGDSGQPNASQLVLEADHSEALRCDVPQAGCHQWRAGWGNGPLDSGTVFLLNSTGRARADTQAAASGEQEQIRTFAIQNWARLSQLSSTSAGASAANKPGSCAKIGCDAPYDPATCQCDSNCEKYRNCCSDYETACPRQIYVLAPNASADAVAGSPVSLQKRTDVEAARSVFSYSPQTKALLHTNSQLCLTQAAPPKRPAYNMSLYHVNQDSFRGVTNMDLGDAAGDTLFDLRIPLQIYECAQQGGQSRCAFEGLLGGWPWPFPVQQSQHADAAETGIADTRRSAKILKNSRQTASWW